MRFTQAACLMLLALASLNDDLNVNAKKPSRGPPARGRPSAVGGKPRKTAPVSRRSRYEEEEDEYDDEEEDFAFPGDEEEDDYEEEEEVLRPMKKTRPSSGRPSSRKPKPAKRRDKPARPSRYEEEEEDYYEEDYGRPSRGGRPSSSRRGRPSGGRRSGGNRGGRVVPYARRQPEPSVFSRGISALRDNIPDPSTVKDAALGSFSAARETTSRLSSNIYREVKGLTSSELEQVMLKATRPDDSPVKGKHVERLVGVTYQISSRYDIYDAVLRKLWAKMAERDWRTNIKALYILHRFASDGAPEHQAALKARLRELRRTRDPKRKDKYFNSKQLLAGDSTPENMKFRAFMSRYAHYVLLRAQCFGGVFDEIGTEPPKSKKAPKPITSTCLRPEHLEAAKMVLKAGLACQLKEGEECENTAIAVERVASDLIGLSTAVAIALNRALKGDSLGGADAALIKKWCEFYSKELQPQTRAMVKKTSPKLDAYGLFLPSRMGTTVSQEILQKGLRAVESKEAEEPQESEEEEDRAEEAEEKKATESREDEASEEEEDEEEEEEEEAADEVEEDEYDEYDYEEEEYYDDEDA